MKDTMRITTDQFKLNLFIWEVIVAAIIFIAAWYILKGFKKQETSSKKNNSKFNNTPTDLNS
ncbi:MAG: hypothetical protein ACOVQJ_09435 [Bacteroidia bacterium]|jgi:hypothetical protein